MRTAFPVDSETRVRRAPLPAAALLLVLAVLCAWVAPAAHADGDPASDYLYAASVFVPYDAQPNGTPANQLSELVSGADRAGYPVRVALIASAEDLGSDTPLWGKPQQYAVFLGTELSLVYQGELLVVMPDGVGVYRYHDGTAAQQRLLAGIALGAGAGALARGAQVAVERLAAAAGHPLKAPAGDSLAGHGRSSGSLDLGSSVPWVLVALLCLGGLAWLAITLLRPRRSRPGSQPARAPAAPAAAGRRRLLVPALLSTACLLLAGGDMALARLGHSRAAGGVPQTTTELMGLFRFPAGHPAPNFTLVDQRGRRYSLTSFRGHVVVLEFTDSRCENLCPIISHEYVEAARDLGRTNADVDFVSVNVNPFHDRVSDVAHYSREHGLMNLPNWYFMTGSPAQLRAVWRRYDVSVTVNKSNGEIEHEAPMLFIDRDGRERWLASPDYNQAAIDQWGVGIAQVARELL